MFESIFSPSWSCHHFALDGHTKTCTLVTKVYCRNVLKSCNEHPGRNTSSVLPDCCQWSDHLLFQSNTRSFYWQRYLETKEVNCKVISWQIRSQHYWATTVIVNCKQQYWHFHRTGVYMSACLFIWQIFSWLQWARTVHKSQLLWLCNWS